MATFAERRDKVVDHLGATAHGLSWALLVAECALTGALAVAGVVAAARWTPWGWALGGAAVVRLVGLATGRWRPLSYLPLF